MIEYIQISLGMIFIGVLLKVIPPKKKNNYYGFRTATSLSHEVLWKKGNQLSSSLSILFGVLSAIIGIILYLYEYQFASLFQWSSLILLISIIPITEIVLRRIKKKNKY
ncbi:MAG: SdpI family protein [Cyclobacteriaceae bacterium]